MTTTPFTSHLTTADEDRSRARRALVPAAVAAFLVGGSLIALRSNSVGEMASMLVLDVVAVAVLFGLVVPRALRAESAGGRALGLGIAGLVLALPLFWSGLPLLLGVSASLLGYAGKRASTGSGKCAAALVLGLLAVVAVLAIYGLDWIVNPGAGWWQHH